VANGHFNFMAQTTIIIQTSGPGLYEFTDEVVDFVQQVGVDTGLLTVFVRHTSASLLIQENADPDVRHDIEAFFARLVPPANDSAMSYLTHRIEGLDDMPAHIKSALTQTSASIPIGDGHLMLGTWQGLYLFEHRHHSHRREVVLHAGA
jgi:secondary thiamine-phosphate synthase enzyme